jgi:nucleotidyltransferase substrate binding protein (TIGR01987 family)
MARLAERIETSKSALSALNEALELPFNKIVQDATIQRFEFTLEAMWKLAQLYLREHEGIEVASPKSVFRSCFEVGLLDEAETSLAINMVNDRNLTVHTYNEGLAAQIYSHIPSYFKLMKHLWGVIERGALEF